MTLLELQVRHFNLTSHWIWTIYIEGEVPKYPDLITVNNINKNLSEVKDFLGEYRKLTDEVLHDRPVWRHIEGLNKLYFKSRFSQVKSSQSFTFKMTAGLLGTWMVQNLRCLDGNSVMKIHFSQTHLIFTLLVFKF